MPAGNDKPNDWAAIYQAFITLGIHSQEQRWQPFAAYLVFHSILILAWATIFTIEDAEAWHYVAQLFICLTGLIVGGTWISLAKSYGESNETMWNAAEWAERRFLSESTFYRPLNDRREQIRGSGTRVIIIISAVLIALYVVFGSLSALAWAESDSSIEVTPLAYPLVKSLSSLAASAFFIWLGYFTVTAYIHKNNPKWHQALAAIVVALGLFALGVFMLCGSGWFQSSEGTTTTPETKQVERDVGS